MIRFLQHQTKTKKLFLSAILAVLILGMVLYLGSAFTNTTASANAQGVYAVVVDQEVTTQELQQELQKGEMGQLFFPKGNFVGKEQYSAFIADNFRVDVPTFERIEKYGLLIRKLQSVVQGAVLVTPDEVKRQFDEQNKK